MGSIRVGMTKLIAPNLTFLPHRMMRGVKQFHLVAEPVEQTLVNGVTIRAWGYNGSTPGPVMVVQPGERVQVVFVNRLPTSTSIHWHGLIVPNEVDGVPEIGAGPVVRPGETYVYEFVVRQAGTFMYHAHTMDAKQEMMGLAGMIVSLPRVLSTHREYVMLLQEWAVQTNDGVDMGGMQMGVHTLTQTVVALSTSDHLSQGESGTQGKRFDINPMSMDFNYFTLNGKAYPDTAPLWVRLGERVRIRLGNISMDSHPMHLHGHEFQVVAADGARLRFPWSKNTINIAPGETWDNEFAANNPGVWAFHCHKPHHTTNAHQPGMGGMFTTVTYV
ncbi:multicopper oxidase family protein [Alicyclobacillus acidocaldarius]|uniref:Multicopper oxidase type 3 n=1 Tax=Alicyclobacillus acidocaldarius subsp. acidocaldarius (strain ATCC 27009 / DSM 446 / BCRC 14685 / JCM 5260 / KCTC 1825 / NBRC 15652 / NCIMB 11725 / NRRL B-14509 / 104-IA) TaxID=521098 RepID=C8WVM4_ALIAD|nr:copper oxidase [Alicyclobacillus acidocaldarius]ACV58146.1 multicopper oxidase type 3 [Alicyclobacillus acidocaldarius subsp. acidocaldarius DSM 446]